MTPPTPAIEALLAASPGEWTWGQVLVRAREHGFVLRHVTDRNLEEAALRPVRAGGLRALAQNSARGEFRPLRAAPDLACGWCAHLGTTGELEFALNALYPGSVADWFAVQTPQPPVTSYREFTERQTGMYRISAMLSEAQTAQVIRAICAPACCLKRRLWTVEGQPSDPEEMKSRIPCLEPCALLLEFTRKAMRIEQQEALMALRPDDAATALVALESVIAAGETTGRAAEFSSPGNIFRLRLAVEKLRAALALAHRSDPSDD